MSGVRKSAPDHGRGCDGLVDAHIVFVLDRKAYGITRRCACGKESKRTGHYYLSVEAAERAIRRAEARAPTPSRREDRKSRG